MKKLFAFTLAASLSSIAVAAPETYVIEPTHTLPRFEYRDRKSTRLNSSHT